MRHLKFVVAQALLLRGSTDFDSLVAYRDWCRRLKRSAGMWRRGWISSDGAGWVMAGRGA
jgi:hypothetical protein